MFKITLWSKMASEPKLSGPSSKEKMKKDRKAGGVGPSAAGGLEGQRPHWSLVSGWAGGRPGWCHEAVQPEHPLQR